MGLFERARTGKRLRVTNTEVREIRISICPFSWPAYVTSPCFSLHLSPDNFVWLPLDDDARTAADHSHRLLPPPPPPPTPTPPQVWVEIDLLGLAETGGLSLRTRRVKQSSFGSAALANASVDFGMNRLVETRRGGQARALLEASYSPTLPMYITPTRTL